MTRQTTLSLLAAATFAVILASASIASGEQKTPEERAECLSSQARVEACIAGCRGSGNTASAVAACIRDCYNIPNDPTCHMGPILGSAVPFQTVNRPRVPATQVATPARR